MTPDITVYSTPACPQCNATYRALNQAGHAFTTVDLAEDDAARSYVKDTLGHRMAPVVVLSTGEHWSGYRPDRIKAIGALLQAA